MEAHELEHYNLTTDPYQLINTVQTLPMVQLSQLQTYLDNLLNCGNGSCQTYEE